MCNDYLKMGLSRKDIHIKYGVSKCAFYRYINRFRIHSIEGLKEVGPRNHLQKNLKLVFLSIKIR